MLTRLTFLNTHLGISLGNGSLETTLLGRDEEQTDIGRGRTRNHVLDVILVTWRVDNGVVVLVREKLLGVALNGHTTLTLFLARIKVVGETERRLSLFFGHGLQLFHLTSGDTTLLEDQMTAGSGLA